MTLLLSSVIDVALLATVALVVSRGLKRRAAALRHAVLAAAILTALAIPALELLIPQWEVIHWSRTPRATSSGLVFTSQPTVTEAPETTSALAPAPISWSVVFLVIWGTGATATLAGLLLGVVRLRRLTSRCSTMRTGRWRDATDRLTRTMGIRRPVQLLQSSDPALLVTCGFWRPKIILPADAPAWSDERVHIVLLHELAHIRRFDSALHLAGDVLCVIHWFNPLVWACCNRLRQESEYACDDVVLNGGVEATCYATELLAVARNAVECRRVWASAPAIAHPSTLERRIAAMLTPQRHREPLTRRSWAIAVAIVGMVVAPMTAIGVMPASDLGGTEESGAADIRLAAPIAVQPEPTAPVRKAPQLAERIRPAADRARAAAVAQQPGATISGVVSDETGAMVPGVAMALNDTEFPLRYQTVTDESGRFTFNGVPPSRYELLASLPGFGTVSNVFAAASGAAITRTLTLPLGTVRETITVVCSASPRALAPSFLDRALAAFFPVLSAQAPRPLPVRVGGNVAPPRKVKDVRPACPRTVLTGETAVAISGRIGTDGYMNDVRAVATDSPVPPEMEFTDSALDAARQWVFTPALLNGGPVPVNISIKVTFRPM